MKAEYSRSAVDIRMVLEKRAMYLCAVRLECVVPI